MRRVRSLLAVKNGKLGQFIAHFDLPANKTCCPGRSAVCQRACYATRGRFRTRAVQRRLAWCYRQSLRIDFVRRLVEAIRRVGAIVVRIHVSGDLYSAAYATKWLEVMRQCPKVRFFAYTRSWRVPEIEPVLRAIAALGNVRLWYSVDADTGRPPYVPPSVRLAFLQHAPEARPEEADLVFRTRGLRKESRVGLPLICPQETDKQVNCGNCQHCWK